MKIISSQQYINDDIVEAKIAMLEGSTEITLPCWYVGTLEGEEMAVLSDGHHRLIAARELGITVNFEIKDEPDGLTGEALLNAHRIDGDWYDVETSDPSIGKFHLIF